MCYDSTVFLYSTGTNKANDTLFYSIVEQSVGQDRPTVEIRHTVCPSTIRALSETACYLQDRQIKPRCSIRRSGTLITAVLYEYCCCVVRVYFEVCACYVFYGWAKGHLLVERSEKTWVGARVYYASSLKSLFSVCLVIRQWPRRSACFYSEGSVCLNIGPSTWTTICVRRPVSTPRTRVREKKNSAAHQPASCGVISQYFTSRQNQARTPTGKVADERCYTRVAPCPWFSKVLTL